jgi:hypothetical protein
MPYYFSSQIIRDAIINLSSSKAQNRLFDFLILKRTIKLENNAIISLAKSNSNFIKSLNILGSTNNGDNEVSKYYNPFARNDKTNGYRSQKYETNGTDSTIGGGGPWQKIVNIVGANPRRYSLKDNYENALEEVFLTKKDTDKPSLIALGVWLYRSSEVDEFIDFKTEKIDVELLIKQVRFDLKLTDFEADIFFDLSNKFIEEFSYDEIKSFKVGPSSYLPQVPDKLILENNSVIEDDEEQSKENFRAHHNIIYYGAPGTGKSKLIEEQINRFSDYKRVTFYPDYSYSQFVGGYKPKSLYMIPTVDTNTSPRLYKTIKPVVGEEYYERRPIIDYTVVPGPFLSLLVTALKNKGNNYLLIVEELNRANAASVFGDIFQLLDRDEYGISEYAVTLSIELSNWMFSQGVVADGKLVKTSSDGTSIRLPKNFYIWATMNSADQGVLPLDSAFKRRWSFEYMPLNKGQSIVAEWKIKMLGREISWDGLRREINSFLMNQSGGGRSLVAEDKLLGPFFMKRQELSDDWVVLNKLLLYLRDDLVRHNANVVFAAGALHFSAIHATYTTILAGYDSVDDSRDKFGQDLSKLFTSALAERLTTLYTEHTEPTQNAMVITGPDA